MPSLRPLLRKLTAALIYGFWLLVCIALIDYFFFYRPFREQLRATRPPKVDALNAAPTTRFLSPQLAARVGWHRNLKKSAIRHFSLQKPADVQRICAFGDSFTTGR